MTKTVKLKLLPSSEQKLQLTRLCERYRDVCNYVSSWIFEHGFLVNFMRVQEQIYSELRTRFELNSQITISALKSTTAAYKTVKEQLKQNPYKYKDDDNKWHYISRDLTWLQKPIQFKKLFCDLVRSRNYRFIGSSISFSTLNGTVAIPFQAPPIFEEQLSAGWKVGTAKLFYKNKTWFVAIPMSIETEQQTKFDTIVGIDRGLRFVVATADSNNRSFFYRGAEIMHKRHKFANVRKSLQEKNTKSSRKRLKAIGSRENRWISNVNHCISKALCDYYGSNILFVLEDLTGVTFEDKNLRGSAQQRQDKRLWAFYQLEQFLIYKAEATGSLVLKVNPRYTSQRCPICGIVDKNQRDYERHEYRCRCGYRSNDDRVGALNLLELGRRYVNGESNPKFVKTRNLSIAV